MPENSNDTQKQDPNADQGPTPEELAALGVAKTESDAQKLAELQELIGPAAEVAVDPFASPPQPDLPKTTVEVKDEGPPTRDQIDAMCRESAGNMEAAKKVYEATLATHHANTALQASQGTQISLKDLLVISRRQSKKEDQRRIEQRERIRGLGAAARPRTPRALLPSAR